MMPCDTNFRNIPEELKILPQWVCRRGKIPCDPKSGQFAKAGVPDTWATYEQAVNASGYDGIGFEFADGGSYAGIDLDNVRNPKTGYITPAARNIIDMADSYTELSQSGYGIHILLRIRNPETFEISRNRGDLPADDKTTRTLKGKRKTPELEVYKQGRYFIVTGNVFEGRNQIQERSAELRAILDKYLPGKRSEPLPALPVTESAPLLSDAALIEKAKASASGAKFSRLWSGDWSGYSSQSEADLALCAHLAFWTGRDTSRMDALFRQSGLMRPKWDRKQSGSTYGKITIENAIAACREVYAPEIRPVRASGDFSHSSDVQTLANFKPEQGAGRYAWNDIGNGNLFADYYKHAARYVPERKQWFVYSGGIWKPDIGGIRVEQLCKELADALMMHAISLPDGNQKQSFLKHLYSWQRRPRRETILKDAASVHPVSVSQFDRDPFLFNCKNGTLNLRDRSFHEHDPEDLLSKISGVRYDPEARSERWEQFMEQVMQGDRDKTAFLQKALGYALTGDTSHECFFVLYGPTSRNGKGTTMETFLRLLGDYGMTALPDTIAQKQRANGSGPSEDIARLAGARFVNISEPSKNMVLSSALVKTLTGNDTVTARYLNENSFEFRPQFKLFVNTNHLPEVTDSTLFSSGRVKVIPFERHFTEEERDETLKKQLAAPESLSGILNWALEGLWMIRETGFEIPGAVREATESYREDSDKIGRFLAEAMEQDPGAETRTSTAYTVYQDWCRESGFFPENSRNFRRSLENAAQIVRDRPREGGDKTTLIRGYKLRGNYTNPAF